MACRILRAYSVITNSVKNVRAARNGLSIYSTGLSSDLLRAYAPTLSATRNTSFFNKLPAEQLWKGVTSVSNAGRKRGRGRGLMKRIRNLNKGQVIGQGVKPLILPGLNTRVLQAGELQRHRQLPRDTEFNKRLHKLRDEMSNRHKRVKLHPLERGWSGGKFGGRSIGPPDPIGEDTFEGFDTRVLEFKTVAHMTSVFGRKRSTSVFSVTGNSQGLAGFALAKGADPKATLKTSKNRAAQRLMHIKLDNNHTVLHDFFCQFNMTKIFVTKKHQGYGLVCHRAIKSICEVLGIRDLHAKIEGSTNVQCITKAFFIGLLQQKTYLQLAEEKKLHVVELRKENDYFPTVMASPSEVRKPEEIDSKETMDFTQFLLGGKVVLQKRKFPPFYTKLPSWTIYQRKQEKLRNKDHVRIRMFAEHGELRSFLTDKYPEAKPLLWNKSMKNSE